MGIKNLNSLLRKKCPSAISVRHLRTFSGQAWAVDASLYMYKFKARESGTENAAWLRHFVRMVQVLRDCGIRMLFVFDGVPPPDKQDTCNSRTKARHRIKLHKEMYSDLLLMAEEQLEPKLGLCASNEELDEFEETARKELFREQLRKLSKQDTNVTRNDFDLLRELLDQFQVPYVQAEGEAEATCAFMCVTAGVDAVLSDDSDVIVYGTPSTITNLNLYSLTCTHIHHPSILAALDFTQFQFVDLAIMCGTDYNSNIPKIGAISAHKLLALHGSIEQVQVAKSIADITCLRHERCRVLFSVPEGWTMPTVDYDQEVDAVSLNNFLFCKNCAL